MSHRLENCFKSLKARGKTAYISFITAGDPSYSVSEEILLKLPETGVDIIELGMPFSDPMADGPIIQASSLRAIKAHHTMKKTFSLVESFRKRNDSVPVILMGYYNLILSYGKQKFLQTCHEKGVDGLIIVDLPAGEEVDFYTSASEKKIDIIYLIAPTTSPERLKIITSYANGFLYYVMITGVTGTKTANLSEVSKSLAGIRNYTQLPIAVGFGIKEAQHAKNFSNIAQAVVVGSALVEKIGNIANDCLDRNEEMEKLFQFSRELAVAIKGT